MHAHSFVPKASCSIRSFYGRLNTKIHCNQGPLQLVCTLATAEGHDQAQHPETVARIAAIKDSLISRGIDKHPQFLLLHTPQLTQQDIVRLEHVLHAVHPASYLAKLQDVCNSITNVTMIDDSTYIAPGSYSACCQTAAAVLDVLETVLAPHQQRAMGLCLVRPPGHHVKASRPMGFGLMNFMAVSATHALQHPNINKVLVLDWDVHHGNGTEDIFYQSNQVLYISTHQQGLWPYTGKLTATGSGAGEGYTINVPLPGGAGHDSMVAVWQHVIEPAASRFKPDLILCSAGFDAHWADPLAGLQLESRTYHMLTAQSAALAQQLCHGRCMWILEGGYHVPSLCSAVLSSISAVLPDLAIASPCAGTVHLQQEPLEKVQVLLQKVVQIHGLSAS